jgi:DNA-binding response OmpR family regulator
MQNMLTVGDLNYDMNSLEVTRKGILLKLSPIGLKLWKDL